MLGLLDKPERATIDEELEQQCPACIAGVQRSINLWLVFAGSLQQVEPAADFRARLIRITELSNRVLTVPKRERRIREPAILISSLIVICLILGTLLVFTFLAGRQSSRLDLERAKAELVSLRNESAEDKARYQEQLGKNDQLRQRLNSYSGPTVSENQLRDELSKTQAELQSLRASSLRDEQRTSDNSTLVNALESPGVKLLTFKGSEGVSAYAYAFVIENSKVVFVASKLQPPSDQHIYQLWLIRKTDHQFVSLAVLPIAEGVPAVVTYENKEIISDLAGLVVTEEPLNGSSEPSTTKVLETPGAAAILTSGPAQEGN